jgi:hypothetical protein
MTIQINTIDTYTNSAGHQIKNIWTGSSWRKLAMRYWTRKGYTDWILDYKG